jgi:hypothetical protein
VKRRDLVQKIEEMRFHPSRPEARLVPESAHAHGTASAAPSRSGRIPCTFHN